MTDVEKVIACANENFESTITQLSDYLRFPAISCQPENFADVERLASKIAEDLAGLGFESVVRKLPAALPLVFAERKVSEALPTLLIYGHLDLQPVRGEPWATDPHEAVRKDCPDGERLFARGAADDMGGWVSHLAAISAWLSAAGELPLNLKLVIEGEEEIGSPNLERYMDAFPSDFESDAMVLTDCENPSLEIPGLTTSLRGLLEFEIHCDALQSDGHSGLYGNMVPDVSTALMRSINALTDDWGRPRFGRVEVEEDFLEKVADLPLDARVLAEGAHLRAEASILPEEGKHPAEWLWRQPALTVLSTSLPQPGSEKNALRASARAVLSVRVPPGRTPDELLGEVQKLLSAVPAAGVQRSVHARPGRAQSWLYHASGPAFAAADRAYTRAFGRPLMPIGIGGSIPFVALFGRRFSHLPLILNGVMDPLTGAHGPNESLHLGLFQKAIVANICLYQELSQLSFSPPASA